MMECRLYGGLGLKLESVCIENMYIPAYVIDRRVVDRREAGTNGNERL
jgi:hypothetical protein